MEEDKKEVIEVQKVENNEEKVKTNNNTKDAVKKTEENNKKGWCIASLVLGIISIVFFCLWNISIPCGVLAIIFGIAGIKSKSKGMAISGLITGAIGLLISMTIVIFIFVFGIASGISDVVDKDNIRSYKNNYSYNLYD